MSLKLYIFEVRHSQLVLTGILNQCSFVDYTEKLNDAGDFRISLAFTDVNRDLCKVDRIVWLESDVCGLIERVLIDPSSTSITLIGRMMSCMLSRRVLKEFKDYSEDPKSIGQVLLDSYESSTKDEPLLISSVSISSSLGRLYSESIIASDLLELFKTLCSPDNLGFRVSFEPSDLSFHLRVFEGADRTVENLFGNEPVVFSQDNDSIETASYEQNIKNQPNTAVVQGEGDMRFLVYKDGTSHTEFTSQEVYLDYSSEVKGDRTDSEYRSYLTEKAQKYFQGLKDENTYEARVNTSTYRYREDYSIGDFVTTWDTILGIQEGYQITQVTKSFDSSGEKIEPILGIPQKDLVSILQDLNRKIKETERKKTTSSSEGSDTQSDVDNTCFTLNKLYYGNKEYNLQRGTDKRILAITQGNKCTTIYSDTRADSEVAALAAVMKGLDEPWTLEYDVYSPSDAYYAYPMSGCPFESGTTFEVDWGDTTESTKGVCGDYSWNIEPHVYEKQGLYRLRIKTEATKLNLNRASFDGMWNWAVKARGRGNHVYIGGTIEEVVGYDGSVTRVSWGESIKHISESYSWGSNIGIDIERNDIALPSFVETVSGLNYLMTNFLYVPSTCVSIVGSFNYCSINEIIFEDRTLEIHIAGQCFSNTASDATEYGTPYGALQHVEIPPQLVSSEEQPLFMNTGLQIVLFGVGTDNIGNYILQNANRQHFGLGSSFNTARENRIYAFIPRTVSSIGNVPFYDPCVIVYQGTSTEWEAISKEGYIVAGSSSAGDPEEIIYLNCTDSEFYSMYMTLTRLLSNSLQAGEGIAISGTTISLIEANEESFGGVRVVDSSGIKALNGVLYLKEGTTKRIGGVVYGDGLQREPHYEEGLEPEESTEPKGYSNTLSLRVSEEFEFIEHPEDMFEGRKEYQGRKLALKLGKGLSRSEDEENKGALQLAVGKGINVDSDTQELYLKTSESLPISKEALPEDSDSFYWKIGLSPASDTLLGGVTVDPLTSGFSLSSKGQLSLNLGDGLEIGKDGKLKAVGGGGVNIESAVIIQEADAKYLLHEYTELDYIAGNKIGYAGAKNPVIMQNIPVCEFGAKTPNGVILPTVSTDVDTSEQLPDVQTYTTLNFPNGLYIGNAVVTKLALEPIAFSTTATDWQFKYYCADGTTGVYETFTTDNRYPTGCFIARNAIWAPNEDYPYGYATVRYGFIYAIYNSTQYRTGVNTQYSYTLPFGSETEYNAAVALTYEPVTLTEVTETITEV